MALCILRRRTGRCAGLSEGELTAQEGEVNGKTREGEPARAGRDAGI